MSIRTFSLAVTLAASFALAGCGAGERLSSLNPFSSEEDDPNAPAQSERISILELEERLSSNVEAEPVRLPAPM